MVADTAPQFTLEAVSGRKVSLADFQGRVTLFIFSSRNTGEQARAVGSVIRRHCLKAPDVALATIVDLHDIPRVFRGMAKPKLEETYHQTCQAVAEAYQEAALTPPQDLADVVHILPDWDGKITRAFAVGDVGKAAAFAVVDKAGQIRGRFTGEKAAPEIIALLDTLRA
jgi:cytochrome oxidase Cu insertion factor (SCO1/SenC/PrrC family)